MNADTSLLPFQFCTSSSQEEEKSIVVEELAKLRRKFKKMDQLHAYDRKKYILKLLYVFMLGYECDVGHAEAVSLISQPKYAEKQVGYMVTSVILNESNDFLRMAINSVRNDVVSKNESFQCLALACIANVGGAEFAESLAGDVVNILLSTTIRPLVRKKAALCLLRLFRKMPEILNPEEFSAKMAYLLEEKDLGICLAVVTLLDGIVSVGDYRGYENCVSPLVSLLERVVKNRDVLPEYLYYGIPAPWLQARIMRVLRKFPTPEDAETLGAELAILKKILTGTEKVANVNKNNALNAVLFEVIALTTSLEFSNELLDQCATQLGEFARNTKEPNVRYLGLSALVRLASSPDTLEAVKPLRETIVEALRSADVSIRKRSLGLLFAMCDHTNAREIVGDLLQYVEDRDDDYEIQEELVLKCMILAERFSENDRLWYASVAMQMIDKLGDGDYDVISDDVWFRLVQVVTNDPSLHAPAAKLALGRLLGGAKAAAEKNKENNGMNGYDNVLGDTNGSSTADGGGADVVDFFGQASATQRQQQAPQSQGVRVRETPPHDMLLKSAGYMLGEFGYLITNEQHCSVNRYVPILISGLRQSNDCRTRQILASSLCKICCRKGCDAASKQLIMDVFQSCMSDMDEELQQRCSEYLGIIKSGDAAMFKALEPMPEYPKRDSWLEKMVQTADAEDDSIFASERAPVEYKSVEKRSGANNSNVLDLGAIAEEEEEEEGEDEPATTGGTIDLDELLGLPSSKPKKVSSGGVGGKTSLSLPPTTASVGSSVNASTSAALDDLLGGLMLGGGDASNASTITATTNNNNDLFGLNLGNGGAAAAALPPAQQKHKSPPLQQQDLAALVGGFDDPFGIAPAQQQQRKRFLEPTVNVEECVRKLLAQDSGVLYEDAELQIGIKSKWQGSRGRLALYLGNKTEKNVQFSLSVDDVPEVKTQLAPLPQDIGSKMQAQCQMQCACYGVFVNTPKLVVAFDGRDIPPIELPIHAAKFYSVAQQTQPQDFFAKWHQMSAIAQKQKVIDVNAQCAGLSNVCNVLQNAKWTIHESLDPNPANAVFGARFFSEQNGELPLSLRLESDATNNVRFRVTVVSVDANLSNAAMRLVQRTLVY